MVWCGSTEAYQEPSRGAPESSRRSSRACSDNDAEISPEPDLRLRRAAEPACRTPTARRTSSCDLPCMIELADAQRRADRRQGLQDRPDADEDDPRARASRRACSACAAGTRPTSSATATARCSTIRRTSSRRRCRSSACSTRSSSPRCTPTSTATSTTSCASTTTRPAATTRRAGTTSTSSGGWATRCRSRSTSSAATRSSPRRSCSTSRCSSTSPPAPARRACRSGSASTSSRPQTADAALPPEHDIFIQQTKLKNTLREWMGEAPVTHSEAG